VIIHQLEEFKSYGISSVIINQDTSDDIELWKVRTKYVVGACSKVVDLV